MNLQFEPITTLAQWDAAAHQHNLYQPNHPVTGEQLKDWAGEHPEDKFIRRILVLRDGEPTAYVRVAQTYWLETERDCVIGVELERAGDYLEVWVSCLNRAEQLAKEGGLAGIQLWLEARHTDFVAEAEKRGFKESQRNPVSVCDPARFDAARFEPCIDKTLEAGYEIMNLIHFAERYSEDWVQRYYDWDMTTSRDIPMPGEFKELPFETYEKMVRSPTLSRECYFLAVKDGTVAASSQLNRSVVDGRLAGTGLTATLREHRRQGLATALKASSIKWAKANGVERIETDNEVNNPMYQLNLALGFEHEFDVVALTRDH